MKAKIFRQYVVLFIIISTLLTFCSTCSFGPISYISILFADDLVPSNAEFSDYCSDFSAFADRFIRPVFPENASADEQKNWYALKKTCGRDLIKLSMSEWPTFDLKPDDVKGDVWDKFIAQVELGRFRISEAIFDENHGGTLIKKYYSTDYESDKIIALSQIAEEQVSSIKELISTLTQDDEWKALRNCEIDFFLQDFRRWFIPYCHASLSKIPPIETFSENPDLFLSTADLLEFAVDFISDSDDFIKTLDGISELLKAPNAKDIRVFHGRYEGFELISRDVVFKRYCDRIAAIEKMRLTNILKPKLVEGIFFNNRQTERFEHRSLPQWGGKNPNQHDYFYVVFPKHGPKDNQPLYVVLHSAGHSAKAALECTQEIGNHDVYHVPEDFYGLFLDCFENRGVDWWWGGRRTDQPEITDELSDRSTADLTPVEKRVLDEIAWVIDKFQIDSNRVYLCGNSMGGSGTLGIGLANGGVFAAIKSNVPAGIWHAYDRLQLSSDDVASRLVDPPVCFDYSSPIDSWSKYHEELFKGMERRKYSYIAYWGNFGHENNDERVGKYNDLFKTFDWTSIRKDEAYPVFTSVSSDSSIPWPDCSATSPAGQRGAYFRWENSVDSPDVFEMTLRLASDDELQTKLFDVPTSSTVDVTVRRLQHFKIAPNEILSWEFGVNSGKIKADKNGLLTIPNLIIRTEPQLLKIFR